MCGIFGIWNRFGEPIDLVDVKNSTSLLRHRGPDDEGYLLVNTSAGETILCGGHDTLPDLRLPHIETFYGKPFDLALGFRRLAILDLSPAGHQPMCSHDGRCWIVFNGEVYNYLELRAELAGYGYSFRSSTDTEVILASYQHWGDECLARFTGMWAFALWDSTHQRLFLSRDRFGIKPLYYLNDGDTFAFASEIKALLSLPNMNRRANPQRIFNYLRYGLTDNGGQTLFQAIQQVPLAHTLDVPIGNIRQLCQRRYWHIDKDHRSSISFEEAAAQLQTIFLDSIRLHLRSDVPVGAALSGGIDSSAIVMAMRHLQGPSLDIHTFSYIAEESTTINEEPWVDIVGQAAGTTVHKIRANSDELVADLDHLIAIQDEPFGSTSIYAQHRVFRSAHEASIKVMLDGQGADELLAGYRPYHSARLASLFQQGKWIKAWSFLRAMNRLPRGVCTGMLLLVAGGMLMPPPINVHTRKFFDKGANISWLNTSWFAKQDVLMQKLPVVYGREILRPYLYQKLVENLPMLLRYEDRNSMAYSIESRVPFLTATLVNFAFSLPEEYNIAMDATTKAVFRQAMRTIVPDAILNRRDKVGFSTPEQQWLKMLRPWVNDILSSQVVKDIPFLKGSEIQKQWDLFVQEGKSFEQPFWRWINMIRWVEQQGVDFV